MTQHSARKTPRTMPFLPRKPAPLAASAPMPFVPAAPAPCAPATPSPFVAGTASGKPA